jgi:glutathione S-transferase
MKLYYSPGACSLAAHIVCEEEDLKVDLVSVDLKAHVTADGADYTAINPKGYVPALQLDDGSLLTENVAILQYLGDRAPGLKLVPPGESAERYRLQEWLAYITAEVHKAFAPLFKDGSEAEKTKAKDVVLKRLKFVDAQLASSPYLLGNAFGVADAYLFVMLLWCDKVGIDLTPFTRLTAFRSYVGARKGVQAALKAEGLG